MSKKNQIEFFICPPGRRGYSPGVYVHMPQMLAYMRTCAEESLSEDNDPAMAAMFEANIKYLEEVFMAELLDTPGTELDYSFSPGRRAKVSA